MFQPAWKDHQFVGFWPDIDRRPGGFTEWVGEAAEPKLAAVEAGRHRGKIINAGQDADAPDLLIGVDVGLEIAAVTVASEFEFPRLDHWFDKA
jgi:hypothetical protein